MLAKALIPGYLYQVTGLGQSLTIIADHPCTAICIALDVLS